MRIFPIATQLIKILSAGPFEQQDVTVIGENIFVLLPTAQHFNRHQIKFIIMMTASAFIELKNMCTDRSLTVLKEEFMKAHPPS